MNPHELAALSARELSVHFRQSLAQKNLRLALDAFAQLESRFQRLTATIEGSQEFLSGFLALGSSPEVRYLHVDDPLARCAARVEYLLELAGERSRAVTEEAILRQIVASRERGFDIIRALATAPEQGLSAGQLAIHLRVSRSNLSPLIGVFYAHGIINRAKNGKNVFVKLTSQGRALLGCEAHHSVVISRLDDKESMVDIGLQILREALREVVDDIRETPYPSKRGILGAADHAVRRVEERIRDSNPVAAGILRALSDELKRSIDIVTKATREVVSEVLENLGRSTDASIHATADNVQIALERKAAFHRETAPLAALILGTVGEEIRRHAA